MGMSGRGRGRGGRGKSIAPPSVSTFATPVVPPTTVEPPPRFPEHSLPEPKDPTDNDLPALRFLEDLQHFMHTSPYFLSNRSSKEHKIDRYSDKYVSHLQAHDRRGKIHAIVTDLSFFPEELHTIYNAEKAQKMAKSQVVKQVSFTDTLAKLKDLEGDDDGEGERGEVEEGEDEVVYEEEELEDETDYNVNYFDNGEEYGDYDDGDEGPIY